jgi:Amt family ammonium transporter
VGGVLRTLGALDFAGGTVVHITAGVAALACVLYVGKRKGFGEEAMPPNNIPLTVLGAGLLWFGWFGFNAGSALSAGPLAVSAFAATHLAAAAGALSWSGVEYLRTGKASALGACAGLVAGLVAITPASGFVAPMSALVIGLTAGGVCYLAVHVLKKVLKLDDSLDAFGVHGIGGIWGALATGMFATLVVNPGGADASLALVGKQAIAVGVVATYTLVMTFAVLWITDKLVGVRVPDHVEEKGLDIEEHGERAYHYVPYGYTPMEPIDPVPTPILAAGVVLAPPEKQHRV